MVATYNLSNNWKLMKISAKPGNVPTIIQHSPK